MATYCILVTFVILMCASSIQCTPAPSPTPPLKPYAIVAFEWPMALCTVQPGCNKVPPAKFQLHGVWPAHGDGTSMEYCTKDPYSRSALKDIMRELTLNWPSYYQADNDFWRYEWEKHGTCSGQSVKEYFDNSNKLYKKMYTKIYNALVQSGIEPLATTDVTKDKVPAANKYYTAMVDKLNLHPIIRCQTYGDKRFFLEMRLCATADLQNIQNCTGNSLDGCGKWQDNQKALFYLSKS